MVSIIMPTYNREKTIKKAIESILKQTYDNFELLIIDDCSSDNTEQIVTSIKDKRVKYIKLGKNSGACHARNVGIQKATGDYIAFQDSDDEWLENKLELQIQDLETKNADLNFCRIYKTYLNDDEHSSFEFPTKSIIRKFQKGDYLTALCYGNITSTQAIIGKSEIFKSNLFNEELPRLQEYDLLLRLASKYRFSFLNQSLVNVYVLEDSISSNDSKLLKALSIIANSQYTLNAKQEKILKDYYINLVFANHYYKNSDLKAISYFKKALHGKFSIKILIKIMILYFKRGIVQ